MPTTNPVPSVDPSDLVFNAQKLDQVVTGAALTFTDRLGNTKKSLAGLSAEFLSAGVYASTSAGLAATTGGHFFSSVAADSNDYLILYLNSAGSAVEQKRYPSNVRVTNATQLHATEALGRAAVLDDQTFKVQGSGDVAALEYRRTNSTTSVLIASYPTIASVRENRKRDKQFSISRPDDFRDLAFYTIQRTNGSENTTLTAAYNQLGGVDIASTSSTRYVAISTDFVTQGAEQLFTTTVNNIAISSGSLDIGISFGPSGVGSVRRHYLYRSDGRVFVIRDDETLDYDISPATAARAFTNGDTVSFSILRKSDGSGYAEVTLPNGDKQAFAVGSIPSGAVWLCVKGSATFRATQIAQDMQTTFMGEKLSQSIATVQLTSAQKANLFAFSEFIAPFAVSNPAGFTGITRDFNIYRRSDATFFTDFDFDQRRPFQNSDMPNVFYVDVATGSDTNLGTQAAPLKSIYQAVNGRSGDVQVFVKPGVYAGNDSWRDANPTSTNLIVEPWAGFTGRIVSRRTNTAPTWTLNTGSTYQGTIVTVGSAVDMSNIDSNGDFTRLTLRTSIAEVDANPGSFWVNSTTVYVRTFDSRVPDADVLLFLNARNGRYQQNAGTVWVKGVDFEGGSRPMQQACPTDGQTNTGYFWDCTFKYSGGSSGLNGLNTDGRCFTYSRECVAASNWADGFNYHHVVSGQPPVAVEIDCIGRNNGFSGSGTNNGSTMHDGGTIIRVNGEYFSNENRNVHDVNNSFSWNLGSVSRDSRGAANRVNFAAGVDTDATKMWLDQTISSGSVFDYETTAGSNIYRSNATDGNRLVSGANVAAYVP